jgi:hypothetical protein
MPFLGYTRNHLIAISIGSAIFWSAWLLEVLIIERFFAWTWMGWIYLAIQSIGSMVIGLMIWLKLEYGFVRRPK